MTTAATPLSEYCRRIADAMLRGKLVPFLGAGVNLQERPAGFSWAASPPSHLPSGNELAQYLSLKFRYPPPSQCPQLDCPRTGFDLDLAKVAQYGEITSGSMRLYEHLRDVFVAQYATGAVHDFLASIPSLLQSRPPNIRHQLIVTTNYDDLMEQSFAHKNCTFDLLYYDAEGKLKGKFWHRAPGERAVLIDRPNEYPHVFADERPAVMKVHGSIDRDDVERDSYVITEDHYIDYLAQVDLGGLIPITILDKLRNSHLLFLGYSLRDWNLRVILRRLNRGRRLSVKSWAVLPSADSSERQFWLRNDIEVIDCSLQEFVSCLNEALRNA